MNKKRFSLIPVRADKRPLIPWKEYQTRKPTQEELQRWEKMQPAGWAVVTGAVSGCIVLDFDGEAGRETLERLGLKPHVQTPSGGYHVYVEHPGFPVRTTNHESDRALGLAYPGMDIKGDGGYAIAFGCANGGQYKWIGPDEFLPFESLPPGLKDVLQNGHAVQQGGGEKRSTPTGGDLEPFIREAVEAAKEIGRNNAAFAMFCKMRDAGFSEEQAQAAAEDFRRRAPERNAKGDEGPVTEKELHRTAQSAFSRPAREKKFEQWALDDKGYIKSAYLRLLKQHFTGRLRWCLETKRWHLWTGKLWEPLPDETIEGMVVRELFEAVKAEIELGKEKTELEWAFLHLKNLNTQEHWKRALDLFKGEDGVATRVKEWDPDPFLLNVQNGVVDLRTGNLVPHDPALMMTRITEGAYRPGAESELFERFLIDITGDDEKAAERRIYLVKILGLALVGRNYRQELYIFHGSGRNGKSTLINSLNKILGTYAKSLPRDVIVARKYQQDAARTALADCEGVRFGVIDELPERIRLSATAIKDLTSNNPTEVRPLYQDYHTALLQVTPVIITNSIPQIGEETEGTWRRIKLIPFTRQIPLDKVDPLMEEKLVREADAILTLLIQGAQVALAEKVPVVPAEVVEKTQEYRSNEDTVGLFIKDRCVFGKGYEVTAPALYSAFKDWCTENGEHPFSQIVFGRYIGQRGVEVTVARQGSKTVRVWRGIGLRADYPDSPGGIGGEEPPTDKKEEVRKDSQENSNVTDVTDKGLFRKFSDLKNELHRGSFQKSRLSATSVTTENSEKTEEPSYEENITPLPASLQEEPAARSKPATLLNALAPLYEGSELTDPAFDHVQTDIPSILTRLEALREADGLPYSVHDPAYGLTILRFDGFLEHLIADLRSTDAAVHNDARARAVPLLLKLDHDDALQWASSALQDIEGISRKLQKDPGEFEKSIKTFLTAASSQDWRARLFAVRSLLELKQAAT